MVDGDTIDIRDDIRGRLRVRVSGIDTPETKKPGYTVGCWGPEATEFAKSNMVGQRVALVTDPTQDRTDRYGRTLAYLVRADGWDYSVEAARPERHTRTSTAAPVSRHGAIQAAEVEARDAGRGLWGPPCFGNTVSTDIVTQACTATAGALRGITATAGTRRITADVFECLLRELQRSAKGRRGTPSGRAARLSLRSRPRRGRRRVRMMH